MTQFITRKYNAFEIDKKTKSVLIKKSKDSKLLDEARYYNRLPKELAIFFPRILSCTTDRHGYHNVELEYYAYSNLGEKLIERNCNPCFWEKIFEFLFSYIIFYKDKHTAKFNKSDMHKMYIEKTEIEYQKLITNFKYFKQLKQYDKLIYNDKELLSFESIWPKIKMYILKNFEEKIYNIIHGDFCFNNILYGINKINNDLILKFIDPRGSFGESETHGDLYYDLAKLSHSCSGGYEYFINDSFTLKTKNNKCELHFINDNRTILTNIFNNFVKKNHFMAFKIKTLEGLIFIGMCARHYDSLKRQKAMYFTGLNILNDIYNTIQ